MGCKEVDGNEPLLQGNLALSEQRPRLDGEVLAAFGASVAFAVRKALYRAVAAMGAVIAIGKADLLKMLAANGLIIEGCRELCKGLEVCHIASVFLWARVVK